MNKVILVLAALALSQSVLSYGVYRTNLNPLTANYTVQRQPVIVQNRTGGLSNILPQNGFVQTSPRQTSFQTTTTTTQVAAPQPVVTAAHTHVRPAPVMPSVGPAISHAHGPQVALPPRPVPGFPHMHSGHPYVAPAVAPQRMTYQQIIEYLTNTNGINLQTMLRNGSGNFLTQCKAYCDTLPPSPVCDSSNILYRNECEAKCVHKTTSTNNLRYGMCCCSDADFDYTTNSNVYFSNTTGNNFCISVCIYNCLGQEAPIAAQHSTDTLALNLSQATTRCSIIS